MSTQSNAGETSSSTTFFAQVKQYSLMFAGGGPDAIADYIFIGISNSKPVVYINYGTGHVQLSINNDVNDGAWHKLQLTTVERVGRVNYCPMFRRVYKIIMRFLVHANRCNEVIIDKIGMKIY